MDRYLSKAKLLKKYDRWVAGYYLRSRIEEHLIRDKNTGLEFIIDSDTLCQCTGLKDKNSVLVFEGDIIHAEKWKPQKYVVEWGKEAWCTKPLEEDSKWLTDISHYYDSKGCMFEVIGNIHNKEKA